MRLPSRPSKLHLIASAAPVSLLLFAMSCGSATSAASGGSSTGGTSTNPYAAAYMAITTWGSGVSVTFPTNCSMTVSAAGTPASHNTYYLAPAGTGQTVVATTPSGIQLAFIPYAGGGISNVNKVAATFNICPTKASSPTSSSKGAIGFISSGEVLFNPYEATNTVAMGDNISAKAPDGTMAYFIDQCNSHAAGGMGANSGSTWHYHAVPTCWTQTVDGATGPSHIIGIAIDGYPIYGGRDINGNAVSVSALDSCNGITSATPEFPSGAYHYVLPLNTNTSQSSVNCYSGTVGGTLTAWSQQLKCKMLMAIEVAQDGTPHWIPALPPIPGSLAAHNLAAQQRQAAMPGMDMAAILLTPPHVPNSSAVSHPPHNGF
jgi:YHYH protein